MSYFAKDVDNSVVTEYQTEEISLQPVQKSLNMTSATNFMGAQTTTIPRTHVMNSFTTVDNTQIQTPHSVGVVSSRIPNQTVLSADNTDLTRLSVTSSNLGVRSMGHLIVQSTKLEEAPRDQERRIRREIANSNERRRMQSINAGFKSLKTILPHTDGEKLSKAAILQQTSEYITQLESDKLKLMHQNEKLRRAFADCKCNSPKHRAIICDIFDKDEGIGSPAEDDFEDMRRGVIEVRQQLDKERRMRRLLEDQVRNYEGQVYPGKIREFQHKMIQSTSSDERRSSSDYSPSSCKPDNDKFKTDKNLPCARPLLPPLAPIVTRFSPADGLLSGVAIETEKQNSAIMFETNTLNLSAQTLFRQDSTELSSVATKTTHLQKGCGSQLPSVRASPTNSMIVFSHSCKSNQPLKKRAIEMHERYSESNDLNPTRQPRNKVAKISLDYDQPAEIGTRSFLPPTLPPISTNVPMDPPLISHTLPVQQLICTTSSTIMSSTRTNPLSTLVTTDNSTLALTTASTSTSNGGATPCCTVSNSCNTNLHVAPLLNNRTKETLVGRLPSQTVVTPGNVVFSGPNGVVAQMFDADNSPTSYIPSHLPPEPKQGVYAVIGSAGMQVNSPTLTSCVNSPVYLTVGNLPAQSQSNSSYIQTVTKQDLGCVALAPHGSRLLVAPVGVEPAAGVQLRCNNLCQDAASVSSNNSNIQITYRPLIEPRQLSGNKSGNVIATQTHTAPCNTPSVSAGCVNQTPAQQPISPIGSVAQAPGISKLQDSMIQCTANPVPQTAVFCYRPPELTLNQLNALPNLPPPRTLHQPMILPVTPSLVQHLSSSSPSYVNTALQEPVLPSRISYASFPHVRRRQSSFSATDSCSTASISGAEEDDSKNPLLDDPDSQSSDSVPTIKLTETTKGNSPTKKPRNSISELVVSSESSSAILAEALPACTLASTGVYTADSGCKSTTTSTVQAAVTNLPDSPPANRRIDAMRMNLETIVQAIDHLEQQERRNSQDQGLDTSSQTNATSSN